MQKDNFHTDIAIMKAEIIHLRKDVNRILEILIENPERALTQRMKTIEVHAASFQKTFDKMEDKDLQIKIAIIGSVFTFLTSIAVLIFEIGFRGK